MSIKPTLCALSLILGLTSEGLAEQLPAPTGDVLLTLSGALTHETADGVVTLDRALLEVMETVEFTTSTIWMEGDVTFTGVPLRDVLDYAGAQGQEISAVALNDYKIEIPVSEIEEDTPIIAYLMNGEPMSRRNKGPLWIVYNYDSDAKYRSEVIYSRSIWQLDRIVSNN